MWNPLVARTGLAVLVLASFPAPSHAALEECRLLRQPDIQGDRIVFVYGGDLWSVAKRGGVASRITSDEGIERFPKISPDGATIAFTAPRSKTSSACSLRSVPHNATRCRPLCR